MARFDGSGTFTLSGGDARLYDIELQSSGTALLSAWCDHVDATSPIVLSGGQLSDSNVEDITVSGDEVKLSNVTTDTLTVSGDRAVIVGPRVSGGLVASGDNGRVDGGEITNGGHGVALSGDGWTIRTTIREAGGTTDNTFDAVNVSAGSANSIHVTVVPRGSGNQTRYAVNFEASAVNNAAVYGFWGDSALYGTGVYADAGTGNIGGTAYNPTY